MKVKIYQIVPSRDCNGIMFLNYENALSKQNRKDIDSSIYKTVFEGEVEATALEDVYTMFNINRPIFYSGRSMSVSDVVEVLNESESQFYYCDSIGFRNIPFDPNKAQCLETSVTQRKAEHELKCMIEQLTPQQRQAIRSFIQSFICAK